MVVVLVLAVLAWLWLSEAEPGPATAAEFRVPTGGIKEYPAQPAAPPPVGEQRYEVGAGELGPGAPIVNLPRSIATTYRQGHTVPPPPMPRGKPGPGGGLGF